MIDTKKRKLTLGLALLLVISLVAGLTAAYLYTKADPLTNEFTFADNIKVELTEPNWDPEEATNLTPGKVVPKDPQLTNTSENEMSEWVAIKLVFTDGSGAPLSDVATDANAVARLLSLIDIDWNTTDWQLADSNMGGKVTQVWAYKYELAPDETTSPLFTTVTIRDDVTPEDLAWLRDDLEGFNIVLDGGAVQYDAFDNLTAAIPALLTLLMD
ncbi:MAG: hypothetical protein LBB42_01825 [Coriobacteriales bacterium]|jgi:hypothetical protein|nr:hypothetical protein [Coriobacteriales bacterium]